MNEVYDKKEGTVKTAVIIIILQSSCLPDTNCQLHPRRGDRRT